MEVGPPRLLRELIESGNWPGHTGRHPLVSSERVRALIPSERFIEFYPPPFLTAAMQIQQGDRFWLSKDAAPDGLDHARAIAIGDFGLGSDSPIVLDFRVGEPAPSVVYLRWTTAPHKNEWVEIASSFQAFAESLGLI